MHEFEYKQFKQLVIIVILENARSVDHMVVKVKTSVWSELEG